MQPLPLLIVNDEVLISNAATKHYLTSSPFQFGDRWQPDGIEVCCPTIEDDRIPDEPAVIFNTTPWQLAWWWDDDEPLSQGFGGAAIDLSVNDLTKAWTSDDSKYRESARVWSMRVVFYAKTPESLQWGVEQFRRKIGISPTAGQACAEFEGLLYLGCGNDLRRNFECARVLDMRPASFARGDDMWVGDSVGGSGAVYDLTIEISRGLWGPTIFTPTANLATGAEICNLSALSDVAVNDTVNALRSQTAFPVAPPGLFCAEGNAVSVTYRSPVTSCTSWCQPMFVRRSIVEFTDLDPLAEYGLELSIERVATSEALELRDVEASVWPGSLFDNTAGSGDPVLPTDESVAGIVQALDPTAHLQLPWLAPGQRIYHTRCGKTRLTYEDPSITAAPVLTSDFDASTFWAPGGIPRRTLLRGETRWVVMFDVRHDEQNPGIKGARGRANIAKLDLT